MSPSPSPYRRRPYGLVICLLLAFLLLILNVDSLGLGRFLLGVGLLALAAGLVDA